MSNEDGISVSPDPRTDSRAYPSTGLYFPQGYPSPHESQVSLPVSDATNSSNKYRKACDACRLKKIRCLGERPVCSNCQSLNIACVYGVRKKKRVVATENSATGSNVNIEKRLIRIESMLRSVVNSTQHLNADAATKSLEDNLGDAEYGLNEPSTIAEIDDAAYTGNHKPGGLFDGFYMKDSLGRVYTFLARPHFFCF
ncbi:hypothetical protein SJAG_04374 [Schizosaccharomyces japonicus yFS275]|uniref:Zn(2)-C6 fungal-type domain-containing protein n=1 Tax=Schizosaccharomyces japonicus (strain yFS275 / FY16936) TaxID=402676 RepID=B6K6N7_SCHJY|nr:hypothetical protein SJAG_04374 [Schizosaccharomyces japonicus yFS275]EEB09191.1 hypothetical protein SJAG_04374 [Schizosaccharomyces japonicus yFS275]